MPVIASGGAGAVEHFPPAVEAGADAVLAASVFHFGQLRIGDVKDALAAAGVPVRRRPPTRWAADGGGAGHRTRATSLPAGGPEQQLQRLAHDGRPAARSASPAGDVGAPQHQAAPAARRAAGVERRRGPERVLRRRGSARGAQPGWARRTSSWWMANSVVLSPRSTGQASGDHGGGPDRTPGDDLGIGRRVAQPVLEPVRPGAAVRRSQPPPAP